MKNTPFGLPAGGGKKNSLLRPVISPGKEIELALSVEGGEAVFLAEEDDPQREALLQKFFGRRLEAVLKIDPTPMLILGTGLLEKGKQPFEGQDTWVYGYYQVWVTSSQFKNEIAPLMVGNAVRAGHIWAGDFELAVGNIVWAGLASVARGLDDPLGTPSAVLYVKPNSEFRQAVRLAVAQGTLEREFPLSLRQYAEADPDTRRLKKYLRKKDWGLDFVAMAGVEGAALREPITLNDTGGREMELTFLSVEAMLADADVKKLTLAQAEQLMKDPERIKQIALSAPLDILKERADVKAYFERPTREEVLKSLKAEEIVLAMANAALRAAAEAEIVKVSEETKKFMATVPGLLLAEGLDQATVDVTIASHDFSHRDAEKVKALGRTIKLNLSGGSGGESSRVEEKKPPAMPTERDAKTAQAELENQRAGYC